jgi:hypothetical protein
MSEPPPKPELMPSLGRLVKGLSALFWGLPVALLTCIKTAANEWSKPIDAMAPILATALLLFGLIQLGYFRPDERLWHGALDRAKLLALVNLGLAPFLFFWNRMPNVTFFAHAVAVMVLSSLVFLFNLNQVLHRLTAMMPDETVRSDTRLFTAVNRYLLIITVAMLATYYSLMQIETPSLFLIRMKTSMEPWHQILLLMLVLLPTAMTMTLIWKIKEMILGSVFGPEK